MGRTTAAESARIHEEILRATVEEIALNGYAGLRVREVAQRIGKTQGSVYSRYDNKADLAVAAIRTLRDELMPRVMSAMQGRSSALQKVEALSATIAGFARDDPTGQRAFARLSTELASDESPLAREIRGMFDAFVGILTQLFGLAQKTGEVQVEVDARTLALSVVCLPVCFMTASVLFEDAQYDVLEAQISQLLTRGLTAPA